MLIGYARVSTQDQHLELQIEALVKAGCQKIFDDKITGKHARCLEVGPARPQRKNLVDLVGELHQQGVKFRSLTDAIDTATPSGRFFFHVMASLAQMERELSVERTRAGLEVARQLGP
jgi:DNA invertase Pin-like site-specific DNA recombinase